MSLEEIFLQLTTEEQPTQHAEEVAAWVAAVRNIAAIAGKELRGYFASPIAWVMMGLFALIFGYFFNGYLDYFVRQSMQAQFGGGPQTHERQHGA